jgi:hypothetical protein
VLLQFRLANHRSIRGEVVFSLVASEFNDGSAWETKHRQDGKTVDVLPTVGVFGANASGKSNLLAAMRFMRHAVIDSFADWAKRAGVPREPFKLDSESRALTSLFEVDLLLGAEQVRYTYGFEVSDDRVEAEWLHAYPKGRRQTWFDRDAARGDEGGEEYLFKGDGLAPPRDDVVRLTRPNALFLSVGATLNHPQLAAVHRWFMDNMGLVSPNDGVRARTEYTRRILEGSPPGSLSKVMIERLLRRADLGIARAETDPVTERLRLWHRAADGAEFPLDFESEESLGTQAWIAFLGPLARAFENGGVLLVDELDASLHPTLAAEVIRLVMDPEANPEGAQLLFTTHDATLLGSSVVARPLARDQVWIAVKGEAGASEYYPVSAAKPRQEDNLERGYLRGRYGGIPRIAPGELARELAYWVKATEALA